MTNKKLEIAASNDSPADLALLQSDLAKLQEDVMDILKHLKEEGLSETRYLKKRAVEGITEQIDSIQNASNRNLKRLEKNVKSRPTQSVAIAFAVGVVASLFLGRR